MSQQVVDEVLGRLRERCSWQERKGKRRILEEFCEQWSY